MPRTARTPLIVALTLVASLAGASAVHAAPTNVSPGDKTPLSGPITFGWTLAAGENASTVTIDRLRYFAKNQVKAKLYERATVADSTMSYTTKKRYFFGDYRWSVTAKDAAGAAVAGPKWIFTVKENLVLGAPKVSLFGRGGKQLRVVMPMSTNDQYFTTVVKITTGGRVWWAERANMGLVQKAIDRPLKGMGFITERPNAQPIKSGTRFRVVTTVKGEGMSRTTSTTFVA